MSAITTLSSQFQITIPEAICKKQRWKAGQEFVFIPRGASVLMIPATERRQLPGIARGADPTGYRDREDHR